jgi:hypothetical protein
LRLTEREYGGGQIDWLIEFNGLRVRNQILRISRRHDLIVLSSNQQRRGLDSRGVLPYIQT